MSGTDLRAYGATRRLISLDMAKYAAIICCYSLKLLYAATLYCFLVQLICTATVRSNCLLVVHVAIPLLQYAATVSCYSIAVYAATGPYITTNPRFCPYGMSGTGLANAAVGCLGCGTDLAYQVRAYVGAPHSTSP